MAIADDTYTPEPISYLTIPIEDSSYHLFLYSIFLSVGNGQQSTTGEKSLVIFADKTVDYTYTAAYLSINRIGDNA